MNTEIKLGKYRHFKGNEYEVIGIANHSETMEEMVVYRALYGEQGLWVRPASMWLEKVERDGKIFQRFTYIGENSNETQKISREHEPVVYLDVVLEAFESPTNDWTYYYDLKNHENIFIFESKFMDDELEREMLAAEPERFLKMPKKREIAFPDRTDNEDWDEVLERLAIEWCEKNQLIYK